MTESQVRDDAPLLQRVLALKTLPVLATLEADDLAAIAERTHPERLPRGAVVVGAPDAPAAMHLVLAGEVDEADGAGGVHRRAAPWVAGGLEALAAQAPGRVVAATDVETLALDAAALWELLAESFDLVLACLASVARATCAIRRRLVPSGGYPPPAAVSVASAPTGLVAQIAAMHRDGPLAGAPIHALGLLATEATLLRAEGGRRLWSTGDDADRVLVVLAGRVRATSPEGHAFEQGASSIVGSDAALAGDPRWYDLTTTGPCVLLDLPAERLVDVLEDDWPMAMHVLRSAAGTLASVRARDAAVARQETSP